MGGVPGEAGGGGVKQLVRWWRRFQKSVKEYLAEAERLELERESAFPREDPKEHRWLPADADKRVTCARCGYQMSAEAFMFFYQHGALEWMKCESGFEAVPAAGSEAIPA